MSAPSIGANKYKLKLIHSQMFACATGEIKGKTLHTAGAASDLHCLEATPWGPSCHSLPLPSVPGTNLGHGLCHFNGIAVAASSQSQPCWNIEILLFHPEVEFAFCFTHIIIHLFKFPLNQKKKEKKKKKQQQQKRKRLGLLTSLKTETLSTITKMLDILVLEIKKLDS